ncbi:MAG: hypothetical protein HFG27_04235 [Provencibacterium sp.]|jgi:ABC-2 type transport system permease protein|nr:hypothetical protein [Provencibacterium sp.]
MADKPNLPRRLSRGARTLFGLYRIYGRLDLLWLSRDTGYCLLYMVSDTICAGASVGGVLLLCERLGGFGGMGKNELLFLLSYAVLVSGLCGMLFCGNNMGHISRIIGRGQLDHCMIQPVPLWMQLLAGGFLPFTGSSKLLCGAAMCVYSIRRLGIAVTPGWTVCFLLGALASAGIMMATVYLISCLAFLAPAAAEEISMTAFDLFETLKSYPLGSLPILWQAVLCSAVPVGLTAWLPSRALLRPDFPLPGLTILAAVFFLSLAAFTFQRGMLYYASHGSPRYSGFGHR